MSGIVEQAMQQTDDAIAVAICSQSMLEVAIQQRDELREKLGNIGVRIEHLSHALNQDGRTTDGITKFGAVMRLDAMLTDIRAALAKVPK